MDGRSPRLESLEEAWRELRRRRRPIPPEAQSMSTFLMNLEPAKENLCDNIQQV